MFNIERRIQYVVKGHRSINFPGLSEMNIRARKCNSASPWYGNSPGNLVQWVNPEHDLF